MLTYKQLADLPESVVEALADVEQIILDDMVRRIRSMGEISSATMRQMERMEVIMSQRDHLKRELARGLKISEERLVELFDEACTRTLQTDNDRYDARGYKPIPLKDNHQLQQVIRAGLAKTLGEFKNLTRTTANTASRQFEDALDLAHNLVASGGQDYQSAIKTAIKSLASKGLKAIEYPSGWTDYLDVAVRRAVLTGVSQTAAEIQLQNAQQLGADLMELTAHPGARPEHAEWQGRVVSLSGAPGYLTLHEIGYGTVTGFKGANCRHDWLPYFEGDDRAYPEDKLDEYARDSVQYNGQEYTRYEASQKQRHIERQIRKWKREASALDAAGLNNAGARAKVSEWQARQRDFIKQTGLTRDYFRERAGRQFTRFN